MASYLCKNPHPNPYPSLCQNKISAFSKNKTFSETLLAVKWDLHCINELFFPVDLQAQDLTVVSNVCYFLCLFNLVFWSVSLLKLRIINEQNK